MDFLLAALLLLGVQQFAWPASQPASTSSTRSDAKADAGQSDATSTANRDTKSGAGQGVATPSASGDALPAAADTTPPRIESFLEGRNQTVDAVALTGRVVDASPTYGDGVRLTMQVETAGGAAATGLVSVSLRETSKRWRTGDRFALTSRLRRLLGFGNFGELDWAAYNARRGLFVTASAWNEEEVQVLAASDGVVDSLRRRFSEACEAAGGQGAEILEALIIGDRTGIDLPTSIAVRDAGLAHFLAISGSHMALLVVVVVGAVRWLAGLRPSVLERFDVLRGAAVLAALAVVAYGAVSGGGVSVARSELMALAAMAALWRGRPGDDLRALGGSAIMLALAMPGVGEEAGFQLSYLAVIALVMDARRQRARRREERGEERREAAALARATGSADHVAVAPEAAIPEGGSFAASSINSGMIETAGTTSQAALPGRLTNSRPLVDGVVESLQPAAWNGLHLLAEAARLTVVCWLVTSPVVAHHFQRISLVAPLANLLAAPLVSAIVISGIGGLVLLPVSPLIGGWAVWFGACLSEIVVRISTWCASLPMAATTTPAPGALLTMALTGVALAMLLPPGGRRGGALLPSGGGSGGAMNDCTRLALVLGLSLVSAALVADALHDRYRSDRLDAWFASVGQGDAAIVRMPGGKVWVVDEGPPGRGRMVVGPLLRRAWINRVDVLVASHLQSDHAGAIEEILSEFEVGEVWLPDGPCDTDAAKRLMALAAKRGVPVRFVSKGAVAAGASASEEIGDLAGETVDHARGNQPASTSDLAASLASPVHGAGVDVLGPPPRAAACNDNDQSLVMAFKFASRRVLFTGDIEAAAESRVAREANVRADVLKVPHHGSRTSSTEAFLSAVSPSLAIASLGLDNHFHHPAPEVVARYDAHGARLLRTDRDGAVHLRIDADGTMTTETFHPSANGSAR